MCKITKNKVFSLIVIESDIAIVNINMMFSINKINKHFITDFCELVDYLIHDIKIIGVIFTSKCKYFSVGEDIDFISKLDNSNIELIYKFNESMYALENSSKILVAALSASAYGAGYSFFAGFHYRISVNSNDIYFGLSEMKYGFIPGFGGVQKLLRLIGIKKALDYILKAKIFIVTEAFKNGLIDNVIDNKEDLIDVSIKYIRNFIDKRINKDIFYDKITFNKCDVKCAIAEYIKKIRLKSNIDITSRLIILCLCKGVNINLKDAMLMETKYFIQSLMLNQSKVMINTGWRYIQKAKHKLHVNVNTDNKIRIVGIIGAGMMGSSLAFVCLKSGYNVVLYDVNRELLYTKKMFYKSSLSNKLFNNLIIANDFHDFIKCDLIIEAVFEKLSLKKYIFKKLEKFIKKNAILATNTSALSINMLSRSFRYINNFIGTHFFSPADKMQLVEIIIGNKTSYVTLNRILNFIKCINKIPIIVNDKYAFFTTRVFCAYVLEGVQLVAEGVDPSIIDRSAVEAGMAVGPLLVLDAVTLTLMFNSIIKNSFTLQQGYEKALLLLDIMINKYNRLGKFMNHGFYDYTGKRTVWNGLYDVVNIKRNISIDYIKERIMARQCVEVVNSIDDNILNNEYDAELGLVFGLGFPMYVGGPLAFMNYIGINNFISKLQNLQLSCGKRFASPYKLYHMAINNKIFLL